MALSVNTTIKPTVAPFFDPQSNTYSYVVRDPNSTACAVIDPVQEFDQASGRTANDGANRIIDYIEEKQLEPQWIVETHVHADHLSAANYLQERLGGQIGIGDHINAVQETFGDVFNEGDNFDRNGAQFDRLFHDGDHYQLGELTVLAMHTPGHTPACMVHIFGDAVFVGDTLFMPDAGTARADFPGGDSGQLYDSIQKILALPGEMRVFICHDYGPNGRDLQYLSNIAQQRDHNIHVGAAYSRGDFVTLRNKRDASLAVPTLILPALQVNMRAGQIPCDRDGRAMLKLPINAI